MAYGCRARKQHLCHRTHRAKCIYVWSADYFRGGDGDKCRVEKNGTHVTISKTHRRPSDIRTNWSNARPSFFVSHFSSVSRYFCWLQFVGAFCCCWTEPKGVASEMPLAQFVALPFKWEIKYVCARMWQISSFLLFFFRLTHGARVFAC